MDGKIITNFIALRPKMYCLKVYNEKKPEKESEGCSKTESQKSSKGI